MPSVPFELDIYLNYMFPNTMASAIQAVRVAESFAQIGVKTTFFYRGGWMPAPQWKKAYGVEPSFIPRRYPGLYVRGRRLPLINDILARISFTTKIAMADRSPSRKIVYGWNPRGFPLRFFLALRKRRHQNVPLIACEAHEGKDWAGTQLHEADVIIAISEGAKRDLLSSGIAAEKIVVAHDGVDLSAYRALRGVSKQTLRVQLGLHIEGPLAVFTGQLYRTRGAETAIEAIRLLPGATVVFVGGDRRDQEHVRRAVAEARLQQQVVLIGEQLPSQIPRYQMAADILLLPYSAELPTKNWCSPMKLFEYLAAGVPIVASDLPVFHEVAEGDKEIVYVPPDDSYALARGMSRVLTDAHFAAMIGHNALCKVEAFAWQDRARRIYDFFEKRLGAG